MNSSRHTYTACGTHHYWYVELVAQTSNGPYSLWQADIGAYGLWYTHVMVRTAYGTYSVSYGQYSLLHTQPYARLIHTRARARTHTRTHTHICTHACMHAHIRRRTRAPERIHTHTHTHTYTHTRTHTRSRARTHARTHAHTHTHTHTHTCKHTHTRAQGCTHAHAHILTQITLERACSSTLVFRVYSFLVSSCSCVSSLLLGEGARGRKSWPDRGGKVFLMLVQCATEK